MARSMAIVERVSPAAGLLLAALLTLAACRGAVVSQARVRVLSLNAWMLPSFSKLMAERLARLPTALKAQTPDVICLQEIWTPSARAQIVEALAPDFHASSAVRGGLVTLSRSPIVEQEFLPFPVTKGLTLQELIAGKGILLTVLEVPGGRLRVANTHLAWDPKPDGARTLQLAFLRKTLAPLTDLPLLLAGDLNTALSRDDGAPTADGAALAALGLAHADPLAGQRLGDLPTATARSSLVPTRVGWPPRPESGWAPDHILFRDGLWRTVLARDYRVLFATSDEALSDHRGLCVDIMLAP